MGEGATLPEDSHPICFGLCLLPGAHATAGEVIVAAGDGLLDSRLPVAWASLFLAVSGFVRKCGQFIHKTAFQ